MHQPELLNYGLQTTFNCCKTFIYRLELILFLSQIYKSHLKLGDFFTLISLFLFFHFRECFQDRIFYCMFMSV